MGTTIHPSRGILAHLLGRLLLVAGALLSSSVGRAAPPPRKASLRLLPEEVDAGLFFDGARVEILASVLPGNQVAVLCRGAEQHLELKRKGRVWGVLWMSVGDVSFKAVPSLYLLSTSAPLASLAGRAELERLRLGYPSLRDTASSEADFHEMIRLHEKERVFSVREGGAQVITGAGGVQQVLAECVFPARTPIGSYQVELYAFKEGRGELLISRRLEVKQAGSVRFIAALAENRPLLHGFFAVLIAIVAGLLTGVLFGRGGKKAH